MGCQNLHCTKTPPPVFINLILLNGSHGVSNYHSFRYNVLIIFLGSNYKSLHVMFTFCSRRMVDTELAKSLPKYHFLAPTTNSLNIKIRGGSATLNNFHDAIAHIESYSHLAPLPIIHISPPSHQTTPPPCKTRCTSCACLWLRQNSSSISSIS